MEEVQVVKSRTMLWVLLVFIPIAGLGLTVYDMFFRKEKESPAPLAPAQTEEEKAQALYTEGSQWQAKSDYVTAYEKYRTVSDLYGKLPIAAKAQERISEIKVVVKREATDLVQRNQWEALRQLEPLCKKLLPEEVPWLTQQLTKADEEERTWQKKWQEIVAEAGEENPQKAIGIYTRALAEFPQERCQTQLKEKLAQTHDRCIILTLEQRSLSLDDLCNKPAKERSRPEKEAVREILPHLQKYLEVMPTGERANTLRECLRKLQQ